MKRCLQIGIVQTAVTASVTVFLSSMALFFGCMVILRHEKIVLGSVIVTVFYLLNVFHFEKAKRSCNGHVLSELAMHRLNLCCGLLGVSVGLNAFRLTLFHFDWVTGLSLVASISLVMVLGRQALVLRKIIGSLHAPA